MKKSNYNYIQLKEFEFIETNYDKFYNTDNYKINIFSFFSK